MKKSRKVYADTLPQQRQTGYQGSLTPLDISSASPDVVKQYIRDGSRKIAHSAKKSQEEDKVHRKQLQNYLQNFPLPNIPSSKTFRDQKSCNLPISFGQTKLSRLSKLSNLRNASGRITVPIMDTSRLKQQKRTLRQNKLLGEERRERNSMKEKEFVSLRTPLDKISNGSKNKTLHPISERIQLDPVSKPYLLKAALRTKAGLVGKQAKINQDIGFIELLQFGVNLFCVCDGHGVNGHLVSEYIKTHLIKFLKTALKKQKNIPDAEFVREVVRKELEKTNKKLLDQAAINTELSGSTVIVVVVYDGIVLCFNVGDSRAILIKQRLYVEEKEQRQMSMQMSIEGEDNLNIKTSDKQLWKRLNLVTELSIDQKPQRQDEKKRILSNGGRIFGQTDQNGEPIGQLRVWEKEAHRPGLAMTRSFGDKSALRAGTSSEPQIIEHRLTPEDMFIVLGSDGVWEFLSNSEVMDMVIANGSTTKVEDTADQLMELACDAWYKASLCRDDITLIVVKLQESKL